MSTRPSLRRGAALPAAFLLLMAALAPAIGRRRADPQHPVPRPSPCAAGSDVSFDIAVTAAANTRVAFRYPASLTAGPPSCAAAASWSAPSRPTRRGNATVELSVDVPADAAAGTSRITLSGSGGGTASLALDVEVSEEAAGSVTMTTDVPSLRGICGHHLPVHPDPAQRHHPGRDVRGQRHRSRGLGRERHAQRPGAGGERDHRGRRHLEHLGQRRCAGHGGGRAPTPSRCRPRSVTSRSRPS